MSRDDADGFYWAEQVRELERRAIAAGTPAYGLMQRAAAAAFRELTRRWPKAQAVSIVCGPGNNGGDGFEIARLAKDAGWKVAVWQVGKPATKGAADQARKAWLKAGGKIRKDHHELDARFRGHDGVVVDAIFGTGLSRAPEGLARDAIREINDARKRGAGVLAVDVPSGLNADSGAAPGDAVIADLTVTFIARKPGLFTGIGPDHAGRVVLDGLQLPAALHRKLAPVAGALEPDALSRLLPRRRRAAHKGDHGHVLVIGGDQGMGGAALLAGRAALRGGAGWVSVATHPAHAAALTAAQPEMMVHGIAKGRELRTLFERATVVAAGCGLGTGDWGRELWPQVLSCPRPMVVDADGLNWLAENTERREDWVLTPHPGEAARLLGIKAADVQADRIGAARRLAEKYAGVAVLKGAGTLVQGATLSLCARGTPGLAVGGTGDVLCGLIAALMAQGLSSERAAQAGVLAHALAGERAAVGGERGLLPTDLLAELRAVVNP